MHIEFLGPPGAGKSTIHSQLIERSELFGGIKEDAVQRKFFQEADPKYTILYKRLPPVIQSYILNMCISQRFIDDSLKTFVNAYPSYSNVLPIMLNVSPHEPKKTFDKWKRTAEEYYISIETVQDHETLCLDQSFVQRLFNILWWTSYQEGSFEIEEYLNNVPMPRVLIHIDAPADVCINRQRQRGKINVSKDCKSNKYHDVQEKLREICFQIVNRMQSETNIIQVDNVNSVADSVEYIEQSLPNC